MHEAISILVNARTLHYA